MKIHEYQAKEIFKEYNIPIPAGKIAITTAEAEEIAKEITLPCVIKAQVHSGARGKAGGIKIAKTLDEIKQFGAQILGMDLASIQSAGHSIKVRKVLVEQAVNIDKELYFSLVINRELESITIITSPCGGMDIEEIAKNSPEKVFKEEIDTRYGIQPYNIRNLMNNIELEASLSKSFGEIITNLYRLFNEKDCSLLEINPLVITKEKKIVAVDAKINFDDNALFRHPDIFELRDIHEENPLELEASKYNLSYIKLDGTVGCIVNGAGLAMTTMDIIKIAGLEPANFLDVGGGASAHNIEKAFKILLSDKNVKTIFINIFGGILKCDILAEGIKNAVKGLNIDIPIIIRLEGTNVEEGKKILNTSGLKFTIVKSLTHATTALQALRGIK